MFRRSIAAAFALTSLTVATGARGADLAVTRVDSKPLGTSFNAAGISGIAYAGGSDYWAVMDNSDRLLRIQLTVTNAGMIGTTSIAEARTLGQTHDFEGIVLTGTGDVLLAEEGTPGVRRYNLATGAYVDSLPTPAVFANRVANFGFESLTRTPDGSRVWTANEEALTVDGPRSTSSTGSVVRLLSFDTSGATPTAGPQYAYVTQPIHSASGADRSGLVDLVALPDGRLIALERSAATAFPGLLNRIYEIDFTGATDVSGLNGLTGQTYTPVTKRLLWQGTADGGLLGQNLEGLTLGPEYAPGKWALVAVVDDGDPVSENTIVTFQLTGIPEPTSFGCVALGMLVLRRRPRR